MATLKTDYKQGDPDPAGAVDATNTQVNADTTAIAAETARAEAAEAAETTRAEAAEAAAGAVTANKGYAITMALIF